MPVQDDKVFEQLCLDFRSSNDILWRMPAIVMTLTGGLWLAVTHFPLTEQGREALLGFASGADLLMIAALFWLRYVMVEVQRRIRLLDGGPAARVCYVIVSLFSLLLAIAALGSWRAAKDRHRFFVETGPSAPACMAGGRAYKTGS